MSNDTMTSKEYVRILEGQVRDLKSALSRMDGDFSRSKKEWEREMAAQKKEFIRDYNDLNCKFEVTIHGYQTILDAAEKETGVELQQYLSDYIERYDHYARNRGDGNFETAFNQASHSMGREAARSNLELFSIIKSVVMLPVRVIQLAVAIVIAMAMGIANLIKFVIQTSKFVWRNRMAPYHAALKIADAIEYCIQWLHNTGNYLMKVPGRIWTWLWDESSPKTKSTSSSAKQNTASKKDEQKDTSIIPYVEIVKAKSFKKDISNINDDGDIWFVD